MAYDATTWVNDSEPAMNAENLNKIEAGISEAHTIAEGKANTGHSHAWSTITGKPAVIAAGADADAARSAIGAGTSDLTIGTTASTAKAGNYTPTIAQVTGLEARLTELEGRIEALEPETPPEG